MTKQQKRNFINYTNDYKKPYDVLCFSQLKAILSNVTYNRSLSKRQELRNEIIDGDKIDCHLLYDYRQISSVIKSVTYIDLFN